ncbi:unnamed protein product [Rotaria magnacalcarata]|uniref:Uncharacterized protein n=1 Tax=Rotaria magnacalcarata TaxID=392030 RepID=A0A8S2N4L5_9BILA|nr:unnamed protein product [Rotaria magnacalcarata]CAF4010193.1 unnamed protein product [Rotaria magnacalcarata]CAF4301697.1 unnamed protein product [Rotaria magnacalcarata]
MDGESNDLDIGINTVEEEQEMISSTVSTSTLTATTTVNHKLKKKKCTINLLKTLFETTSTIAKSLSCAKTKSRAIACNVLAPYFTRQKVNEYFSDIGVKIGYLDFIEDSRETALDIFNNTIKVIENHQLQVQNLTSIGADNAKVNFGEYHSVFKLFKDRLPNIFKDK